MAEWRELWTSLTIPFALLLSQDTALIWDTLSKSKGINNILMMLLSSKDAKAENVTRNNFSSSSPNDEIIWLQLLA